MKIQSLVIDQEKLVPVEVEVTLIPGLPTIHVLGLPDQVIKESLLRIKSAIRSQGFEWPKARQIIVNIRPINIKKSSRGLELAIALGILWATGQVSPILMDKNYYVYGELSLSGEVFEPDDLNTHFFSDLLAVVLTGQSDHESPFCRDQIQRLKQILKPTRKEGSQKFQTSMRPQNGIQVFYSEDEAKLLSVIALGEFHALLAGPSGVGKSTLIQNMISFLSPPDINDFYLHRTENNWRPWIAPHHSTTSLAMIGGTAPPKRGEISRADGGVLFLDELLEFNLKVQDALREPLESGFLRLGRGAYVAEFPAQIQLLATTNLCPCGSWMPGLDLDCERSAKTCRSYINKISGPFFDRFNILALVGRRPDHRLISGEDVLKKVEQGRQFLNQKGIELNEKSLVKKAKDWLGVDLHSVWNHEIIFQSERRKLSTLRVAVALSVLKEQDFVDSESFEQALNWTLRSFEQLKSSSRLTMKGPIATF